MAGRVSAIVSTIWAVVATSLAMGPMTLDVCLVQWAKVPWAVDGPKSTLTSADTRGKLMHVLGREPCRAHSDWRREGTLERVELRSEAASAGRRAHNPEVAGSSPAPAT